MEQPLKPITIVGLLLLPPATFWISAFLSFWLAFNSISLPYYLLGIASLITPYYLDISSTAKRQRKSKAPWYFLWLLVQLLTNAAVIIAGAYLIIIHFH